MRQKRMKGACLAQRKETSVVSCILGFRNENENTSINTNCKKGGMTLWRN